MRARHGWRPRGAWTRARDDHGRVSMPPLEMDRGFVVATRIACSAPTTDGGVRHDGLRDTGHVERHVEDAAITASMGIRYLRYGIPFHAVARDPDHLDWAWSDGALATLRHHGIEPIVDLLDSGVPPDLWGTGDIRLPDRFLPFVERFIERFPWVRYFTPVSAPWVAASRSGRLRIADGRRDDDRSLVQALDMLLECNVRAMAAIRAARPGAIFLQSDVCERWEGEGDDAVEEARRRNEQRFIAYELSFGRRPSALAVRWLKQNGMSEPRLDWYARHGSSDGCIVGNEYDPESERVIRSDGRVRAREPRVGYASLAREYHERLGSPFMLSGTHTVDERAPGWLRSVWNDALRLREDGLPIRGVCWDGLTDRVDREDALARDDGHVDPVGLVDLDRRYRPVGLLYRNLALDALEGRSRPFSGPVSADVGDAGT